MFVNGQRINPVERRHVLREQRMKHKEERRLSLMTPALPTIPFEGTPVRHLCYHIYPMKHLGGQVWRRNVDQLLKGIHVFTGQRRVSIAVDTAKGSQQQSESAQTVIDYFGEGHGIEFLVQENRKIYGEVVSYLPLFEPLETSDQNVTITYMHAKGVKHRQPNTTVHRWTSIMYEVLLDGMDAVDAALTNHIFAGCFRRLQRMGSDSEWHFSGTFWTARAMWFFQRDNWRKPHKRFFGVESLPGRVAKYNESECLLCDEPGSLYHEERIKLAEQQLAEWRARRAQKETPIA